MIRILMEEAKAEFKKDARAPEFILPTLALPVAFYGLFAIAIAGSPGNAGYLLATFGVFAVMGPCIFGFGINVAKERETGWLLLKRAVPASPLAYLAAKILTTVLFLTAALIPVYLVAYFGAGVRLSAPVWGALALVHLLSAGPFVLIGLILGFSLKSNAAVGVSNLVFLVLAAIGGLWLPITALPAFLQAFAVVLPSYHLAEIALAVSGAPGDHSLGVSLLAIAAMTAALSGLALWRWQSQR